MTSASSPGSSLVTIGLPVYNGARYLPRALDALLAQRDRPLELLVADNGSTDETPEIAARYAARDARVRVMRSPVNLGVEANFARVLDAASGAYFMWAACDDWWAPEFVDRMAGALEADPRAVVAMCAVERVDETGALVDLVRHTGTDDPSQQSAWQLSLQLAAGRPYHLFVYGLYRTAFIKRAFTGFAPVVAADRLLLCRVAMAGGFAYVDDVLHRRTVRRAPIAERYAGEPIGRLWQGAWPRLRLALLAGPYLWQSPVIPPRRRLWIPAIVLRFAAAAVGHAMVASGWMQRRAPSRSGAC